MTNLIYIVVRLWIIYLYFQSFNAKPYRGCDYVLITQNKLVENCSKRGLDFVPSNLRRTINSLDPSDNFIVLLPNESFVYYTHLEVVNLSFNNIFRIEKLAFTGLINLHEFGLNDNLLNISQFSEYLFQSISNLTVLDLSGNLQMNDGKNQYPDMVFSFLWRLTHLSIDMYSSPTFGPGFRNMTALSTLKFERCYLLYKDNS